MEIIAQTIDISQKLPRKSKQNTYSKQEVGMCVNQRMFNNSEIRIKIYKFYPY